MAHTQFSTRKGRSVSEINGRLSDSWRSQSPSRLDPTLKTACLFLGLDAEPPQKRSLPQAPAEVTRHQLGRHEDTPDHDGPSELELALAQEVRVHTLGMPQSLIHKLLYEFVQSCAAKVVPLYDEVEASRLMDASYVRAGVNFEGCHGEP